MHTQRPGSSAARAGGSGALALALALTSCAGSSEGTRTGSDPTRSGSSPSMPSTSPADSALPPAAQGLEPCPGEAHPRFSFRLAGERVTGLWRGSGARVVILTHQSRGTPCDLAALGARLADDGYRVLAWTSERSSSTRTLRLLVEHERRAGATYVALVGASLGAATSITAAASVRPAVDAVVACRPPTSPTTRETSLAPRPGSTGR
jgi:hypothetical protein